jgi:hypothetical protein
LDFTRIEILALLAITASLIAIVLVTFITLRQRILIKRYRTLFSGETPSNLDEVLVGFSDQIHALQQRVQATETHLATVESTSRKHLQTPGIVRFRAFTDTGSDLSFSIALLDQNQDGIVISSLYGRAESRIYAKPIKAGQSTYTLSEEEKAALQQIQNSDGE